MNLIKTSIGIGKTLKNVQRLKEILQVFAKHGFEEFIDQGIISKIPNFVLPKSKNVSVSEKSNNLPEVVGRRLCLCFEELGPVFIKFGQLLSSREDMFDPRFIAEFRSLKDNVNPLSLKDITPTLEKNFGKNWKEAIVEIDENPIGMASIGVVFKGKLVSGESVAIKIRRPGIEKIILRDFEVLKFISLQAEKFSTDLKFLKIPKLVEEFAVSLDQETNFFVEANNCERLKKDIAALDKNDRIYLPEIYNKFTREDVLVMEFIDGVRFTEVETIKSEIENLPEFLEEAMKIFLKTFFVNGFFHADLHGGNFFYYKNKLALIDFGLMGFLTNRMRRNLVAIIYSLVNFHYEQLIYEFLDVAEFSEMPNVDELTSDVKSALSPYLGLSVQQTNISVILNQVLIVLKKHHLYLPRDWYIVFRAIMTLDGVGRDLGTEFDIYNILNNETDDLLKETFSKEALINEASWGVKDILVLLRILPRQLKWFFNNFSKNGYAIDLKVKNFEKSFSLLSSSLNYLALVIFSGLLFLAGSINLPESIHVIKDIPLTTLFLWGIASLSFVIASIRR